MNDEEIRYLKLLKLKDRKGDQIIQTFCKIGSPEKLDPHSLICRNLKTLRKVLLNDKMLKVVAVSLHFRSLEFCGKTIGYHTKHLSMVWMFSNFFKRCLLGVRAGV